MDLYCYDSWIIMRVKWCWCVELSCCSSSFLFWWQRRRAVSYRELWRTADIIILHFCFSLYSLQINPLWEKTLIIIHYYGLFVQLDQVYRWNRTEITAQCVYIMLQLHWRVYRQHISKVYTPLLKMAGFCVVKMTDLFQLLCEIGANNIQVKKK